jgi:hypothetical protein
MGARAFLTSQAKPKKEREKKKTGCKKRKRGAQKKKAQNTGRPVPRAQNGSAGLIARVLDKMYVI